MTPNVNHRQAALLDQLFEHTHARFPMLVRSGEIECSPEDQNHLWIFATGQVSAQEESDAQDYIGMMEADILEEYGYRLSLMLLTEAAEEIL
jgi:hypothetical protein